MRTPRDSIYAGHRYPAEIISYAVWLYFRFPLSLRMVEEMLAARSISVTHETIRQWGLKFGREFASRIRRRAPRRGDKWYLDEIVIEVAQIKILYARGDYTQKQIGRISLAWLLRGGLSDGTDPAT